jgi:hypothetical protein
VRGSPVASEQDGYNHAGIPEEAQDLAQFVLA